MGIKRIREQSAGHFYDIMMEAPRQDRFKMFPPLGFDRKPEQQE